MLTHRTALRLRAQHQRIAFTLGEGFHAIGAIGSTGNLVPALAESLTAATDWGGNQAFGWDIPQAVHALASLCCLRPLAPCSYESVRALFLSSAVLAAVRYLFPHWSPV